MKFEIVRFFTTGFTAVRRAMRAPPAHYTRALTAYVCALRSIASNQANRWRDLSDILPNSVLNFFMTTLLSAVHRWGKDGVQMSKQSQKSLADNAAFFGATARMRHVSGRLSLPACVLPKRDANGDPPSSNWNIPSQIAIVAAQLGNLQTRHTDPSVPNCLSSHFLIWALPEKCAQAHAGSYRRAWSKKRSLEPPTLQDYLLTRHTESSTTNR